MDTPRDPERLAEVVEIDPPFFGHDGDPAVEIFIFPQAATADEVGAVPGFDAAGGDGPLVAPPKDLAHFAAALDLVVGVVGRRVVEVTRGV
jgi:hypothetical protein